MTAQPQTSISEYWLIEEIDKFITSLKEIVLQLYRGVNTQVIYLPSSIW